MSLYEKIQALCRQKGHEISRLCVLVPDLNISRASITGWKKGAKPRADKIKKIADYFGVPISYFSDDFVESNKTAPEEQMLSEGEETLLKLFRQIAPERQELVLAMIRAALQG